MFGVFFFHDDQWLKRHLTHLEDKEGGTENVRGSTLSKVEFFLNRSVFASQYVTNIRQRYTKPITVLVVVQKSYEQVFSHNIELSLLNTNLLYNSVFLHVCF